MSMSTPAGSLNFKRSVTCQDQSSTTTASPPRPLITYLKKKLEIHAIGSYINGEYGEPYDFVGGLNYFPFKNRAVRFNGDVRYTYRSPVGYLAFPNFVGTNGVVYVINTEINF
jgi:hypothetical protein